MPLTTERTYHTRLSLWVQGRVSPPQGTHSDVPHLRDVQTPGLGGGCLVLLPPLSTLQMMRLCLKLPTLLVSANLLHNTCGGCACIRSSARSWQMFEEDMEAEEDGVTAAAAAAGKSRASPRHNYRVLSVSLAYIPTLSYLYCSSLARASRFLGWRFRSAVVFRSNDESIRQTVKKAGV